MSVSTDFNEKVALLLPLYLRGPRARLVNRAETDRDAADRAWKTSLRQANWLGEVAARATNVQDIVNHLEKQGERRADKEAQSRFHQIIRRHIGDSLRRQVIEAMQTTARKVAEVLGEEPPSAYSPQDAWVDQEHLKLARLYVGALVAWHRIESKPEEKP